MLCCSSEAVLQCDAMTQWRSVTRSLLPSTCCFSLNCRQQGGSDGSEGCTVVETNQWNLFNNTKKSSQPSEQTQRNFFWRGKKFQTEPKITFCEASLVTPELRNTSTKKLLTLKNWPWKNVLSSCDARTSNCDAFEPNVTTLTTLPFLVNFTRERF